MKKKKKEKERIFLNIGIESEQLLETVTHLYQRIFLTNFLRELDDPNIQASIFRYGKR
jgi:hypothetical protein